MGILWAGLGVSEFEQSAETENILVITRLSRTPALQQAVRTGQTGQS